MRNDVSSSAGLAVAVGELTAQEPIEYDRRSCKRKISYCFDSNSANSVVDVTVCIANWNCRDYLRRCLQSLCETIQHVSLEIIVVDNASGDGAADMVERDFPNVVLIRNSRNAGFARANNQAAATANGRYLFFLNNDTVVPPDMLRRMVDYLQRHAHVGMIGPLLHDGNGRVQKSHRARPTMGHLLHRTYLLRWTGLFRRAYRDYRRQAFDPMRVQEVDVLMGAALMISRQRFNDAGGWDDRFPFGGEDVDLSLRIGKVAPVVYFPEAEVVHYGRVGTRQNLSFAAPSIALGFLRYLRSQGYSRASVVAYKWIMTLDAPLQVFWKGLEYCWRRLWRRPRKAEQSLSALKAHLHFMLRGLWSFWMG